MNPLNFTFRNSSTEVYLNNDFENIKTIIPISKAILLIDENVFNLHLEKFAGWKTIILKPGEETKQQSTIDSIIAQLIEFEVDRSFWLIGVGGGVTTDITGFVASVYMRGIKFGFVPTTMLAMVDASLGGKNGIDVGLYKNLVGTINQPAFILYDHHFLTTLPRSEWVNGMAEVIKHACIARADLFESLEQHNIDAIINSGVLLNGLISTNVRLKMSIVQNDELETGERKLLNFGHTLGHAIETLAKISHGEAISIGMALVSKISMKARGLPENDYLRILNLLSKYNLPIKTEISITEIIALIKLDKKRRGDSLDLILLDAIGKAQIHTIAFNDLQNLLN